MINFKKTLICFLILAFTFSLSLTGCKPSENSAVTSDENAQTDAKVIGEGETSFAFSVIHSDGEDVLYEVHTDEKIVGKALQKLGLISGEMGQYGLYVKTVDKETVDFDNGGKYWAFYIGSEYASQGVDQTEIEDGKAYSFRVE